MSSWAGYTRVSRVGDRGERLLSPQLQEQEIRRWAGERPVTMLPPELDESGGKLERPILEQAIKGIEEGIYEGIVVARLDRLSRSIVHSLAIFERVEAAGGQIVAVGEQIDSTTAAGRMQRNMLFAIGNFELDRHKDGFAVAKQSAVERGVWPTPIVPRGYLLGGDRRLVPGPDAELVRDAFKARAASKPWRVVGEILGCGLSAARKTVTNRVYLGEVRIGEWANPEAHPPLVDRSLWEAAQISHPAPARRNETVALLRGLIRCAGCSRLMTPGDGRYRCMSRGKDACESRATIGAHEIEPVVEQAVLAHLEHLGYEGSQRNDPVDAAEAALAVVEAELEAFQTSVDAAGVDVSHFASGLAKRARQVEEARALLGRARTEQALPPARVVGLWDSLSVEERAQVLRGALDAVFVWRGRPRRYKLIAAGSWPHPLSRPGVRSPRQLIEWGNLDGEIRVAGLKDASQGS